MPLLEVDAVRAGYGDVPILHGVSLNVEDGEIVSLVGANGAGKTTLLRALSRIVPLEGRVVFAGEDISKLPPHEIVARGIAHVPEGRQLFVDMTVLENLMLGAPGRCERAERARRLNRVFALFPRLAERKQRLAGTLSGGEQQMAAIGRGLMLAPRLLMLDEPSLGLAPTMVQNIFQTITAVNKLGMAVLLVEQNVAESLRRSRRAYVLETGRIVLDGPAMELLHDKRMQTAFLGGVAAGAPQTSAQ